MDSDEILIAINAIMPVLPKHADVAVYAVLNVLVTICCELERMNEGEGLRALAHCRAELARSERHFSAAMAAHEFNQRPAKTLQ
jgi:hypothetical protein